MTATSRMTRVTVRAFICRGPMAHPFSALVRSSVELHIGERIPVDSEFQLLGSAAWLPLPLCPAHACGFTGEQRELYNPAMATIPAGERFTAWLAPDGSKLAVPGRNDAVMPARYVRAGYIKVEGHSMLDLDRFDAIRARQTGNDVSHEMNYDAHERQHRRESDPDFDSEDVLKSEV
jgi:hypothetical protein